MIKKFIAAINIIFIIFIFTCSTQAVRKNHFKIKETNDHILINSELYRFTINKTSGLAELSTSAGKFYSSFPIYAQTRPSANSNDNKTYHWRRKSREITVLIQQNSLPIQKVIIIPHTNVIEFNFGVQFSAADTGLYIFKNGHHGMITDSLESVFSPEPDDYYPLKPAVDVRVDRDQQWAFSPAPLNLSFKTKAGWFSIGLAKLPDASIFAFKNNSIYLDYPFNKFNSSKEDFHWIDPIVITFSDSPWDAIGEFRSLLVQREYIKQDEKVNEKRPTWWSQPLVNTWGEQVVQDVKFDNDGFDSNWVRNYVINQEKSLDSISFTLVINDKWNRAYGDPNPDRRFKDMRELIDWCHKRGHKVILWWKSWQVEAKSLAAKLNISDGEYIDATHPVFEAYIDTCCMTMLGNGINQLNADGLKLDNLFSVRNPIHAHYANPATGMGIKELHHYMKVLYKYAKKYKPDCLISGTAIDPHFIDVQDMIHINTNWDNKTRREKRARIITQAMPDILIDGDAANMYNSIALYHYVTSAIYGIPSIHYLTSFHDGFIPEETKNIIKNIVNLYLQKPKGTLQFTNYGNWRILNDNKIMAESLTHGKGIVVYTNDKQGTLLPIENGNVHVVLNKKTLKTVIDEKGNKIKFIHLGEGIYELLDLQKGVLYDLSLKFRSSIYE